MKKILSLMLLLIVIAILGIPYLAIAEINAQPPDTATPVVQEAPATPDLQPVVVYTTGADPPAAAVNLTPLLQAVISLCASLITAFLIPWIHAKFTSEQRQRISAVYQTIVYAAEQLYGAGHGDEKLKWAVEQLEKRGLTVDRPTIEAEVKKLQGLGYAILDGATDGVKMAEPATAATNTK
jgi:uncharacterized alpha/beta hydrolase family protein